MTSQPKAAVRPQDPARPDPGDARSAEVDMHTVTTSFGGFKPVGHVMIGLPDRALADALAAALHGAGWPGPSVQHFSPRETTPELEALVHNAGAMAGFGYEITLLRRYLALAQVGCRWLLVKVNDADQAAAAADTAKGCGAVLAVYYRRFTVEELIT